MGTIKEDTSYDPLTSACSRQTCASTLECNDTYKQYITHTYTETMWSDVMLSDTIKTVDQIYESIDITFVCIY